MHNLYDTCVEYNSEMNKFENCKSVNKYRSNADTTVNNYGYRLIDFLQFNNLYIMNGRTKVDIP